MADEKRFIKTWSDGIFGSNEIWVDKKTGVNYLYHGNGNGGGMTVLLNRDGSPIVTPIPNDYSE